MTTTSAPSKTPRKDFLYYPVPFAMQENMNEIYAVMSEGDGQTTVLFGICHANPDTVYVYLQGDNTIISIKSGGWTRLLRASDGMIGLTKEEGRTLWSEVTENRKWSVIPNAQT